MNRGKRALVLGKRALVLVMCAMAILSLAACGAGEKHTLGGEYVLAPTKSGRSGMITVAPSVMHLLKKQKRQQAQMRLLAGQDWENPWDLVFTNEHGVISLTSWCTRPSKRS